MSRYDCQSCGACCMNPPENRAVGYVDYVQVFAYDRLSRQSARVLRRLTVVNDKRQRHLRIVGRGRDQRCIALEGRVGVSVRCGEYALRPRSCRQVEPGDAECRKRRRDRGLH